MKLYVVKGMRIDEKKSDIKSKRVESFIGYFTNLKEVYSQFDRKTMNSYSSIAAKIKDTSYHYIYDTQLLIEGKMIKFQQIKIEKVLVNKFYNKFKYVNLNPLISQEFSDFKC